MDEVTDRIQKLKIELNSLKTGGSTDRRVTRGKTAYPTVGTVTQKEMSKDPIRFHIDDIDLRSLRPDLLEMMNEREVVEVVKSFMESNPRFKFKPDYPFLSEGMIQKDHSTNSLRIFSRRGGIRIPDTRDDKNADYVYFLVLKPEIVRGFHFTTHPPHLKSAKFRSKSETVIHGYAIIAYPFGYSKDEDSWICWNDSLGMMTVRKRAAMLAMKKQPIWDKQLEVVSIDATYEAGFIVNKITALTNSKDRERNFPDELFLIEDAFFKENRQNDHVFYSTTLKSEILIAKNRIGNVSDESEFEMVVGATFPKPAELEFRAILLISEPRNFWTKQREWIRELLRDRTDAYRI